MDFLRSLIVLSTMVLTKLEALLTCFGIDFALERDCSTLPFGGNAADAISIRRDSTLTMTALAPPNNRCRLRFRRAELFCVGLASDTERVDFARDWTSVQCQ